MSVSIIILAAGSSSRMGQSKQLLPWGEETLLTHAIKTAMESLANHIYVVLGSNEDQHRKAIDQFPVTIVSNPSWEKGMGSSIKAGLKAAKDSDAVLIMTCDMPFVTSEHLNKLIGTKQQVAASRYQDTVGVPALFSKALCTDLLNINDSEGARSVIANHESRIINLESGIDLDTPEDYQKSLPN